MLNMTCDLTRPPTWPQITRLPFIYFLTRAHLALDIRTERLASSMQVKSVPRLAIVWLGSTLLVKYWNCNLELKRKRPWKRDRPIRPKPDNRINKNHTTKYFWPYNRKNRKSDDRIYLPSISRYIGRYTDRVSYFHS